MKTVVTVGLIAGSFLSAALGMAADKNIVSRTSKTEIFPQYEMKQNFVLPGIRVRSNRVANWYVKGEEVIFTPEKPLSGEADVKVELRTGDESIFLTKILPVKEFNEQGWHWKSDESGFYNVRFSRVGVKDKEIAEQWFAPVWKLEKKLNRYVEVARCNYRRDVHALVVTDLPTRKPHEFSAQFGVGAYPIDKDLTIARLVGFRGLRLMGDELDWEKLEPERGKFDWNSLDEKMQRAEQYGFQQEDMLFTTMGVPRWASSRPDSDRLLLGSLKEYKTVVPADLRDWQNFLRALMRRYPNVRMYELWNEPHFPGYSIFWSDTPENHVRLMEAGYRAIKAERPEAIVWWAGLSKRYLTFYEKILELGGGRWFDVLSIHGTWMNAASFTALEKKAGITPKVKTNSEWHANLIKPWQASYPNEMQGARAAMLGFLHMVRQDIKQIYFFTLFNDGGCELDELADNHKYGRHDPNVSGLFRVKPYVQPRYIAAAWHTLTARVKGEMRIIDGWEWTKEQERCAAELTESEAGTLLFFWPLGTEAVTIPDSLLRGLAGANVCSADGRPVKVVSGMKLTPDQYYLASGVDKNYFLKLKNRANVLKPFQPERPLQYIDHAVYRPAPLFDAELNPIDRSSFKMTPIVREIACERNATVGKIRAEFAVGMDKNGLDLLVSVDDPQHISIAKMSDFWMGDSVQFAIDCGQKGQSADVLELGITGNPIEAQVIKTLTPTLEGDLPANYTPGQTALRYAKARLLRNGDRTEYRMHVDATELYPYFWTPGGRVRFSILVNNHDGKQRASYLEWSSGIGNDKDAAKFGTLSVQLPAEPLFQQSDLNRRQPDTDYRMTLTNEAVRIEDGTGNYAGVAAPGRRCVGGGEYRLSFEARGTARLIVMVSGKGIGRLDPFVQPIPLENEWKKYEVNLTLPAAAENAGISFFTWQSRGKYFEIKNMQVVPR